MITTTPTLGMTHDILRYIGFLQVFNLFLRQGLSPNLNRLIQSLQIAETNDRDGALLDDPGQCHLAHLPALLLRQLLHSVDDLDIGFSDVSCQWIRQGPRCWFLAPRPGEVASVERRPGDQPDARLVAEFVHLPFFFTVAERVVILHADELGPAVFLCDELQRGKLVCFGQNQQALVLFAETK